MAKCLFCTIRPRCPWFASIALDAPFARLAPSALDAPFARFAPSSLNNFQHPWRKLDWVNVHGTNIYCCNLFCKFAFCAECDVQSISHQWHDLGVPNRLRLPLNLNRSSLILFSRQPPSIKYWWAPPPSFEKLHTPLIKSYDIVCVGSGMFERRHLASPPCEARTVCLMTTVLCWTVRKALYIQPLVPSLPVACPELPGGYCSSTLTRLDIFYAMLLFCGIE